LVIEDGGVDEVLTLVALKPGVGTSTSGNIGASGVVGVGSGELVVVGEIPGKTGNETPGTKGDGLGLLMELGLVVRGLTVSVLDGLADSWAELLGVAIHPLPPPSKNAITLRIGKFLIDTKFNWLKRCHHIITSIKMIYFSAIFFNVCDR
jgi:hypothetical protein